MKFDLVPPNNLDEMTDQELQELIWKQYDRAVNAGLFEALWITAVAMGKFSNLTQIHEWNGNNLIIKASGTRTKPYVKVINYRTYKTIASTEDQFVAYGPWIERLEQIFDEAVEIYKEREAKKEADRRQALKERITLKA